MVRADGADQPSAQAGPEALQIVGLLDRGIVLGQDGQLVIAVNGEVVRAGLRDDRHATAVSLGDYLARLANGAMDDVQGTTLVGGRVIGPVRRLLLTAGRRCVGPGRSGVASGRSELRPQRPGDLPVL